MSSSASVSLKVGSFEKLLLGLIEDILISYFGYSLMFKGFGVMECLMKNTEIIRNK
jgi:hypothetical protein